MRIQEFLNEMKRIKLLLGEGRISVYGTPCSGRHDCPLLLHYVESVEYPKPNNGPFIQTTHTEISKLYLIRQCEDKDNEYFKEYKPNLDNIIKFLDSIVGQYTYDGGIVVDYMGREITPEIIYPTSYNFNKPYIEIKY